MKGSNGGCRLEGRNRKERSNRSRETKDPPRFTERRNTKGKRVDRYVWSTVRRIHVDLSVSTRGLVRTSCSLRTAHMDPGSPCFSSNRTTSLPGTQEPVSSPTSLAGSGRTLLDTHGTIPQTWGRKTNRSSKKVQKYCMTRESKVENTTSDVAGTSLKKRSKVSLPVW